VADSLDLEAFIDRFRRRAEAVKSRPTAAGAGEERAHFIRQAQVDYQDFAIIAMPRRPSMKECSCCASICGPDFVTQCKQHWLSADHVK
jgi:hypothetical protein